MRQIRWKWGAVGGLMALLLFWAGPVWAHAELVRSLPAANASLPAAPAQIEIFFSEAVEPSFSTIEVLDTAGQPVDNGDSRLDAADPTHLTVSLRSLPDGVYTVFWKVLSEVDGHVTSGAFPFAVGDVKAATLAAAAQEAQRVSVSPLSVVVRWLTFLAAAVLLGGSFFVWQVWQPVYDPAGETGGQVRLPWLRLGLLALVGLALAQLIGLLAQAGQAAGIWLAMPWQPAVANLLFTTRFGVLWLARLVLLLLLAALLAVRYREQQKLNLPSLFSAPSTLNLLLLLLAALLLLTISLGSHAAAEPQPFWPVLADWLHLLATSFWVGGLVYFAAGLWAAWGVSWSERTGLAGRLLPRFSRLALPSVAVLLVTGLYSAVLRVGSWPALLESGYGRVLLVKSILALAMIGLGAVNFGVISGRLKGELGGTALESGENSGELKRTTKVVTTNPNGGVAGWFRRIVGVEVMLGVAVLLLAGLLTSLPPARAILSAGLADEVEVDDLKMEIAITPGRVGLNNFQVRLTQDGRPVDNASEVALRFKVVAEDVPPSEAMLTAEGNGEYSIQGGYLSLPRSWQVQAVVRRPGEFDSFANFNFDLAATAAGGATVFPWHRLAGGLLLAAGAAYWLALVTLPLSTRQYAAAGVVPALALLVVGLVVLTRPSVAGEAVAAENPIPPNIDSIATGQAIYQEQCLPCHGAAGKGDGPVGLTLNPPPADLSLHAVPGVHSDRALYDWITNGFAGSVMPAFGPILSDEERWHVVNFVRTLAPVASAADLPAIPTLPAVNATPVITEAVPTPAWGDLNLGGRLLFLTYDAAGAVDLVEFDLATGEQRSIFRPSQRAFLVGFAVSPDYQQIAMSYAPPPEEGQGPAGYNSLYIMPVDGSSLPEWVAGDGLNEALFAPVWSADGGSIYFATYTRLPAGTPIIGGISFRYDIERLAWPEGEREVVVESAFWPSLSPEGDQMAYLSFDPQSANNELHLAAADGTDSGAVFAAGSFPAVDAHFFSPDGEWLYFSAINDPLPPEGLSWLDWLTGVRPAESHSVPSDWWRLPLAGGEPERLTFLGDTGLVGDFSPDGRHIAFMGATGLYVMNPDGSGLTQLLPVAPFGSIQWIP